MVAADLYAAPDLPVAELDLVQGSAGWTYRAGIESVLRPRFAGSSLYLDPCIPTPGPVWTRSTWLGGACARFDTTAIHRSDESAFRGHEIWLDPVLGYLRALSSEKPAAYISIGEACQGYRSGFCARGCEDSGDVAWRSSSEGHQLKLPH